MQQNSMSATAKQLGNGPESSHIRKNSTKDCGADTARLLGFDVLLNGLFQKMEEGKDATQRMATVPWIMDREVLVKLLTKQPSGT